MRFCVLGKGQLLRGLLAGVLLLGLLYRAPELPVFRAMGRNIPIYRVGTEEQAAAIGINCAWDCGDLPDILSALEREQVKATFFLLGDWCRKYPDMVREIAAHGHEIGSHCDTHTDLTTLSQEQIRGQVENGAAAVEQLTGKPVELIRTPSGAYNNLVTGTIEELGYYSIQWDVDTLDWKGLSAQDIRQRSRAMKNGSILLIHSGSQNGAQALPLILRDMKERGLSPVTVGELIYRGQYQVDATGEQHPAP